MWPQPGCSFLPFFSVDGKLPKTFFLLFDLSRTMDAFRTHVNNVMERQSAGRIVSVIRGQKPDGQRFALVKTQVVWYAVRVIFEGSYAVEREEFREESLADKYIEFKKRALEGGVF